MDLKNSNSLLSISSFKLLMLVLFLSVGCNTGTHTETSTNELYKLFQNPPAEARPFVRWWWNGNCIEVDELQRELNVMKAAGIGGVEINPIAKPKGGDNFDYNCYEWLSHEWNERVKATIRMAKERDMAVDLIMGSGWPFGGEFLKEGQLIQGVGIRKLELEGPRKYTFRIEDTWKLPGHSPDAVKNPVAHEPELFFLQMIPHGAKGASEMVNLMDEVDEDGRVEVHVPEGKHDIYIGTFQKAFRTVVHGAPGSKGPVVDHYDGKDVRAYMDRLAGALEAVLGGKLGDHIRSLFCDSIELGGANITDDFLKEFLKRRGYDLTPFIPLVYYNPYKGYTDTLHYEQSFNGDIQRVRYDFNKTLVELFLGRFTKTFDSWANEHGMKSRYQAYGTPWLMGMLDGYRMVDIPESNNWLYSPNAKEHGYWIWNKYCSSGAHLSGARIVSSEAMTNTRGVFRATLSMVKKNDDFNFISGINHSVLHGYNYSPPEAGFPGWVRYGAYFSDQNTWWPYFRYWAGYNARLSAVFQHSDPVVDVAILTPEADIWKQWGLIRSAFYSNPWYNHDLWEGFSRVGIMADYINEGVIQRATAEHGVMKSEKAGYQLVIVSGASSIEPGTARAMHELARQGVKFLFVDQMPSKSPSYYEKEKNDREVKEHMEALSSLQNVKFFDAPANAASVTSWAAQVAEDLDIRTGLSINPVNEHLYQVRYRYGNSAIAFFSNQDDKNSIDFTATLSDKDNTAWCWDPEAGERFIYPAGDNGELHVRLQPLESLLLVFDGRTVGEERKIINPDENSGRAIGERWQLVFSPAQKPSFKVSIGQLFDFSSSDDERISAFAGKVSYKTSFNLKDKDWKYLDLGVERNITEVTLNGQDLGVRWWGRHLYPIEDGILKKGENELEIIYTTTLANYISSLKNNDVAKNWVDKWASQEPAPMGLRSEVRLLK